MKKVKEQDILEWKVNELEFVPINQDIQMNRINQVRINVHDDDINQANFKISDSERSILNPLNFNFRKPQININLDKINIYDDDLQPLGQYTFKCESISDINSFIHNKRQAFLNNKHQVKIDDVKDDDIKLGENDVWAM